MLYTILQIVAFQALFLVIYDLFLRRETFFNCNRAYLIVTSLLSLILPFVKFPNLKHHVTKDVVIQLPEVFIGYQTPTSYELMVAEQSGIIMEQPQTPIWQVVVVIGIVLASLFFLYKMSKIYWIKRKNPKRWYGNVLIVNLLKSNAAFSFFNTIFLGDRIPENEKNTIYKHELVHIEEWHTIDLIYFELLRIIFWFNPLSYTYQNRIKELHEFIADAKIVKQNGKADYYQSLLNKVFDVQNVSFTNTFFKKSLIKKRIAMLQKSKSKQLYLIKYALLIPLVFAMLVYSSMDVRAQDKESLTEEMITQELTDEELVEKYYKELVEMEKAGKTFIEIAEYVGFKNDALERYIVSREKYLKSQAYLWYIADSNLARKSEEGTLSQYDIERFEELKSIGRKTYAEYRKWKKTKEAKDLWEANTRNGILKLFVEDAANKTKEEKRRFDALMRQLETDDYFKKLVVTDGNSTLVIDSPNDPHPDAKQMLKVVESIEVPFSVIDEVPTTEACKDLPTNNERKACLSGFIQRHVNKKFNKSIADSLNLEGRQRIFVAFKIDKEGNIIDVKARASHKALEDEAERVIKDLPMFIPGRQKGKLVVVPYSLPIVFQTSNTPNYDRFADSLSSKNVTRLEELIEMRTRLLKNTSEKNSVIINLNKQIDSISAIKNHSEKEKLYKDLLQQREKAEIKKAMEKEGVIPYSVVEVAPVHPNCKTITDEKERKKCTSAEVTKFVNHNFNKKMAEALDLPEGQQKIYGAFTIDKQGFAKDIKARAPHDKLIEEFIRVINLLPQFIPGEAKGEKVEVPYSLPIVFQIVNDKKRKD